MWVWEGPLVAVCLAALASSSLGSTAALAEQDVGNANYMLPLCKTGLKVSVEHNRDAPPMLARIGIMRALNCHVESVEPSAPFIGKARDRSKLAKHLPAR